jgi:hypothetical protein
MRRGARVPAVQTHRVAGDPVVLRPGTPNPLTDNLKVVAQKIDGIIAEACPSLTAILKAVQAPSELYVCRLTRPIFSREMPFDQLVKLWDFIFVDGFLSGQPFRSTVELTAIIVYNQLVNAISTYPQFDDMEVKQILFEAFNPEKAFAPDLYKTYLCQLQYLT